MLDAAVALAVPEALFEEEEILSADSVLVAEEEAVEAAAEDEVVEETEVVVMVPLLDVGAVTVAVELEEPEGTDEPVAVEVAAAVDAELDSCSQMPVETC